MKRILGIMAMALLVGLSFGLAANSVPVFIAGFALGGGGAYIAEKAGFVSNGTFGINIYNLTKSLTNGNNMGGIQETIYWGLKSDVLTWPTLSTTPTSISDACKLVGNIAMKPGKFIYTMYNTVDAGELKYELQGEIDGKSCKAMLTIFHPSMVRRILGFIAQYKNEDLFFIVLDAEGQMYLVGDSAFAAKLESGSVGTSSPTAGRKGAQLVFTHYSNAPLVYQGTIPTTGSAS